MNADRCPTCRCGSDGPLLIGWPPCRCHCHKPPAPSDELEEAFTAIYDGDIEELEPPTSYPKLFAAIVDAEYGREGDERDIIAYVWWARKHLATLRKQAERDAAVVEAAERLLVAVTQLYGSNILLGLRDLLPALAGLAAALSTREEETP